MRQFLAFLLCLFCFPAFADDTHQCLTDLSGPLETFPAGERHGKDTRSGIADGSRFDARGVHYVQQTNPLPTDFPRVNYPVDVRADGLQRFCWAGSSHHRTNPEDQTWAEGYQSPGHSGNYNNAAMIMQHGRSIIDGIRSHNAWDGIRLWQRNYSLGTDPTFHLRNNWLTYNRDDCIEHSTTLGGLVEDNLFDGCYVFFSSRTPSSKAGRVTIENNLIRMESMPGQNKQPSKSGFGSLFKWSATAPTLELYDNIFLFDEAEAWNSLDWPTGDIKGCRNNIIVWLNDGPYPGNLPSNCVTVTKDRSIWDNARARWIAEHPKVPRIEGIDDDIPEPPTGNLGEPTTNYVDSIGMDSARANFGWGQPTTGTTRWGTSPDNLDNSRTEQGYYELHRQWMSDLPADTEIFYQVFGCNQQGACGQSQTQSFRTLGGEEIEPPSDPCDEDPTLPECQPEPEPTSGCVEWGVIDDTGVSRKMVLCLSNGEDK